MTDATLWSTITIAAAVLLALTAVLGAARRRLGGRTTSGISTLAALLVAGWTFERELWPWDVLSAAVVLLMAFVWLNAPAPARDEQKGEV